MSDMRLEAAGDRFYYPDVAVVCTPIAERDVVAREPCVVVEVTSTSTARIDRGEKLDTYRRLPALRAYVVADHRRRRVERHWLDAIYRRVSLPAVAEPGTAEYDAVEHEG